MSSFVFVVASSAARFGQQLRSISIELPFTSLPFSRAYCNLGQEHMVCESQRLQALVMRHRRKTCSFTIIKSLESLRLMKKFCSPQQYLSLKPFSCRFVPLQQKSCKLFCPAIRLYATCWKSAVQEHNKGIPRTNERTNEEREICFRLSTTTNR